MSRLRRAARGRRVLGLARDPTYNGGHGPPYERQTVGWGAMSRPAAAGFGFGA